MARIKEKKIRQLKKSRVWITLIVFALVIFFTSVFMTGFSSAFLYYLLDMKMQGQYEAVMHTARLYDRAIISGDEDVEELLLSETDNATYFVRDNEGKILHENGENTCSEYGSELLPSRMRDPIRIYADTKQGFIYADEEGLTVDTQLLYQWLRTDPEVKRDIRKREKPLKLPVWLALNVNHGKEQFCYKAFFQVDIKDALLLLSAAGVLLFMVIVISILMISNVISSIVGQRRMSAIFFMDEVTGGHNWMWFLAKGEPMLKKRCNSRKKYAILDLVFVKYRNYCVCHSIEKGEKALCMVDQMLRKSLGKKELCAHYASANFVLLLEYEEEETLKTRIGEMLKELEQIDPVHRFSFHVGIDLLENATDKKGNPVRRKTIDLEKDYNNACAARATLAKSDDSGVAFFNEKLVEEQKWLDLVQEKQQEALEKEEFLVYYQPKYDPNTNQLRGAEALIRWQSPELGFVSPGRFIPIFEKNGFITKIDHYMLEHVAKDQKAWLDQGFACVPVSVNVSRAHFIESNLAEQIRDMVDAAGTPHEYIELELTESAFFDDKKALITTIMKLKEYGFAVSMDDFGSGYSSLNSLKDMPLDVLKLDAEFFRGDLSDKRGEIVISEAIRLAKSLNMRTVAEGVEIKEQVDFLAKQGCDMIQGFYYAKPLPKEEFEKRVAV